MAALVLPMKCVGPSVFRGKAKNNTSQQGRVDPYNSSSPVFRRHVIWVDCRDRSRASAEVITGHRVVGRRRHHMRRLAQSQNIDTGPARFPAAPS